MSVVYEASGVTSPPMVQMRGIYKYYGGNAALRGVDLTVNAGEVVALLGDNGAGKSTLIKILSGVQMHDEGEVLIAGEPVQITSPAQAKRLGIETVYQDLALCDNLDIPSNIFLGRELKRRFLGGLIQVFDKARMAEETRRLLGELRINIGSLDSTVRNLSGGQRQSITIARSVYSRAKIIILDEPTAALGVIQTAQVLSLIEQLRSVGQSIVLISHNMEDVFHVADRIVILKTGTLVANLSRAETNREDVVKMIIAGEAGRPSGRSTNRSVEGAERASA